MANTILWEKNKPTQLKAGINLEYTLHSLLGQFVLLEENAGHLSSEGVLVFSPKHEKRADYCIAASIGPTEAVSTFNLYLNDILRIYTTSTPEGVVQPHISLSEWGFGGNYFIANKKDPRETEIYSLLYTMLRQRDQLKAAGAEPVLKE